MRKIFLLEGLECANCAAKIERDINKIDGVNEATVNFITTKLIIDGAADKMPFIIKEAEKIVKKYEPNTSLKSSGRERQDV